jgi:hypothetical protein
MAVCRHLLIARDCHSSGAKQRLIYTRKTRLSCCHLLTTKIFE